MDNPLRKREHEKNKYDKNPEPKKENSKKMYKKNKKVLSANKTRPLFYLHSVSLMPL